MTVLVPTIPGRDELLARAMASVRAQTRPADAVLLECDTGRTGAGPTRNRLLARVSTEWTAFLDDDDEFYPHHLRVCLDHAAATGADLVYPWFDMIGWTPVTESANAADPLATSVGGAWVSPFGVPFGAEQEAHLRTAGNFIPITVLVRTEALRSVGGFPTPGTPEWPDAAREDWGGWLRLLDAGATFSHVQCRTWRWNHHDGHTGGLPVW